MTQAPPNVKMASAIEKLVPANRTMEKTLASEKTATRIFAAGPSAESGVSAGASGVLGVVSSVTCLEFSKCGGGFEPLLE